MGYVSESDVIETKGRVACEITSGDELMLTEMIFNGIFNDLTVEQTCALLSCFTFDEINNVNFEYLKLFRRKKLLIVYGPNFQLHSN